jgi:hypothetical protein
MTEAVAPRPDDDADVAPAAAPEAAEAQRHSDAPPGDEFEGYLKEFQAGTSRPATQPDQQTAQSTGTAPQSTGDAIDQLLDELSRPGPLDSSLFTQGADVHQQHAAQEQFSALQSENQQLKAYMQRAADQADFDNLTGRLQAKLPDHLPPDYAATQLMAMAVQNPALVAAFDLRHVDRRAADTELRKVEAELARLSRDPVANQQQIANLQRYGYQVGLALNSREILRRAVRAVEKRGQEHRPIDETATALHDQVAAAVRGASGKAQPEPPPNFGSMSDSELREYTREHFGF